MPKGPAAIASFTRAWRSNLGLRPIAYLISALRWSMISCLVSYHLLQEAEDNFLGSDLAADLAADLAEAAAASGAEVGLDAAAVVVVVVAAAAVADLVRVAQGQDSPDQEGWP